MKKWIFFAITSLFVLPEALPARDLQKLAAPWYTPMLENEKVRVYETRLSAGEGTEMRRHPRYFVYALTEARLKVSMTDGAAKEVYLKAGTAVWSEPVQQRLENIGKEEVRLLYVECKPLKVASSKIMKPLLIQRDELEWNPVDKGVPDGCRMAVLEGDPDRSGPFSARVTIPAGTRLPPHWHPSAERVTVLEGAVHIGQGEQFDEGKAVAVGKLGFLVMPAREPHFAWFEEETVLQLNGEGPWEIHYVNPDDDPRRK